MVRWLSPMVSMAVADGACNRVRWGCNRICVLGAATVCTGGCKPCAMGVCVRWVCAMGGRAPRRLPPSTLPLALPLPPSPSPLPLPLPRHRGASHGDDQVEAVAWLGVEVGVRVRAKVRGKVKGEG